MFGFISKALFIIEAETVRINYLNFMEIFSRFLFGYFTYHTENKTTARYRESVDEMVFLSMTFVGLIPFKWSGES